MPGPLSQQNELPVKIGELLAGKYRIERILGAGGMGIVVAAMHEQLQELVAIKLLLSSVGNRPDFVQRFVREARAAVKIKSSHVARVLDVDSLPDGRLYMVMEYLDGQDLGQLLDSRGACSVNDAVDYVLQVCEALAEAHALGIVHRDLKPSNLFITQTAHGASLIKVLDFGISKVTGALMEAEKQDGRLTGETALIGSPLYMSPEQIRSAKDVDGRTDVWSLGVILHELLANKTPFFADTHVALLASIAADPPIPLRQHVPDASPEIEAVILRCLEKDPAKRMPSVLELARSLGPFANEDAVPSVERAFRAAGRMSANVSKGRPSFPSPTPPTPTDKQPTPTDKPTDKPDGRVSIPVGGADAMAETVNTLFESGQEKRSYRAVAAATALGGLVAVGVAAFLAVRAPLSKPTDASGTSPTASAQAASSVEAPPQTSAQSPTSALSAMPAPPVVSAAATPSSAASAHPDAGAPPPPGSSTAKATAPTPSHSRPDGGIRLGKEVDSRH
jgi:serine/threonine-protein kinase